MGHRKFTDIAGDIGPNRRARIDAIKAETPVDDNARLLALEQFVAAYEATHGEITDDEMATAAQNTRARAVVSRVHRGSHST